MGVFPAASSHALPEKYRKLMFDSDSPIIDFYPTEFDVDMNGKRYAWQGIAKLPFIHETRLLTEIAKVEHTLTAEEKRRNSTMFDMLFIAVSHPLSPYIFSLDDRCKQMDDGERLLVKEKIDSKASGGMNGYISLCAGDPCPPIFRSPVDGMEDIVDNQVICAIYKLPDYHKHISRPPPGVKFPTKIVSMGDLNEPVLWHEDNGRRHRDNGRRHMGNGRGNMDNGRRHMDNGKRHMDNVGQRTENGVQCMENGALRMDNGRAHPGTISVRQLGDAAHRLVINSLQLRADQNAYAPPVTPYTPDDHGYYATDFSPAPRQHRPPAVLPIHQSRPHHQYGRPNAPVQGYYPPGPHQSRAPYPPVGPRAPVLPVPYHHQGGQSYGVGGYNQWGGRPQSHNSDRGFGRGSQQGGNRYAAFDRGSSRRPPSSLGRY